MTAAAEATSRADRYIQRCLLSDLIESGTNPRKRRDAVADEELRNSILEVGVLEPILVRAVASGAYVKFEIIAGSRRYRAAKDAGLEAIPAILKTLTDAEALEVQIVENLQRQDVHPLDEADGYAQMLAAGYTVSQAALKLGKTERYVAQRLALTKLIPRLRELLERDLLTLGVAVEAARHTAAAQEEFVNQYGLNEKAEGKDPNWAMREPIRVANVVGFFSHRVTDLGRATWNLNDAALLPVAGACSTCPKRTSAAGILFDDIPDSCQDRPCFNAKRDRHLEIQRNALADKKGGFVEIVTHAVPSGDQVDLSEVNHVAAGQKRCKSIKTALMADGPAAGKTLEVCTDDACAVHTVALSEDGEPGEDLGTDFTTPKPAAGAEQKWKEEEKKRKAEKAAQVKRVKDASAARASMLAFILTSPGLGSISMNKTVTRMVGDLLILRLAWGEAATATKALGIKLALATTDEDARAALVDRLARALDTGSEEDVNRVLLTVLLVHEVHIPEYVTKIPPSPELDAIANQLAGGTRKAKAKSAKATPDLSAEQAKVDAEVAKIKGKKAKPAPIDDPEDGPCKCASFDPSDDMDEGVCTCGHHEDEHDIAGSLQACLVGHADDDGTEAPAAPSKAKGKAPKGRALKAGV